TTSTTTDQSNRIVDCSSDQTPYTRNDGSEGITITATTISTGCNSGIEFRLSCYSIEECIHGSSTRIDRCFKLRHCHESSCSVDQILVISGSHIGCFRTNLLTLSGYLRFEFRVA